MKIKFWKRSPSLNLFKNVKRYRPVIVCHEVITAIWMAITIIWKSGFMIAAGYAITVGAVVKAILIVGCVLYSYSQSQKAKKSGQARDFRASGHLLNTVSQSEPIPIPYGTCRTGGNVVYKHCTGTDNKFYHRIITFGYGPVNGPKKDGVPGGVTTQTRARGENVVTIGTVTPHQLGGSLWEEWVVVSGMGGVGYNGTWKVTSIVDATHFTYNNTGDDETQIADTGGTINGGDRIWLDDKQIQEFGSLAYWEFFYGTPTQTVCATLQTAHPEFDDAMRDIAYLYLRLEFNSDKFVSEPQVTIEGEWGKLYDPRSGQTIFSANNALVAYDFLRSDLYSIGLPATVFDIDLIKDAANWCDANGYQFNGLISDRQALMDNFEVILQNFRAGLVWSEGFYKLLVYEYDTPVMHLTEDDIEADSFKISAPGIPETPNRVLITYIDAVSNYVSKTKTVDDPQAVLNYDGEERDFELDLKGVTNALQAEKLGSYYVERNRLNFQFPLVAHPRALALDPMDMIQITHSMPGWTEKIVRVLDVEQRQDGKVNLLILAEISSLYGDDVDVANHQHYETTLPDPLAYPPEVTNLILTETTDATGITISFSIPGKETNWSHGEIFISRDGGVTWQSVTTFNTNMSYVYRDVVAGWTYYFKIISFSTAGVASLTPPTSSITMAGIAGLAPTGLSATPTFTYIILDWTNPVTTDIQYIEIWRANTNDRAAASLIATAYTDNFWDYIGTSGVTRYYWIRAKNLNGLYSTWLPLGATDGVWATTIGLDAGDFNTTPPGTPTGLGLTTGVSQGADGTEYSWIRATWTANTESDLSHYEYRIKEVDGNYIYGFITSNDVLFSPVRSNILHYIGIRAIDSLANKSAFCTDVSITSSKDAGLPAVPTSFAAASAFKTIFLTWVNPTDKDLSHINIYRGTTSTRGSATLVAKVKGTFYADEMPSPYYGLLRYYWIASEDTSGNVSATEAGPVNATTAQVATADMENLSVVNAKIGALAVDDAKINDLNASKINAGDIASARMQVQGGNAINAGSVKIDPGKVLISGATTLSDWRHGTDTTKIDGGDIYANSITANKIAVGSRNLSIQGIEISANNPTANTLYWAAGVISYIQDDGTSADVSISAGNQLWSSGTRYLYWVKDATTLSTTTTRATAFGAENIVLASYRGGTDLVVNYGRTIIDGSDVIAGTITGDRLVANTIAAGQLSTGELITLSAQIKNGTIETANIKDLNVDTLKIKGQAVTRGVQYYNGAGFTMVKNNAAEQEIGTITVVTNEATDFVWLWISVQITDCYLKYGKELTYPSPIDFKIRRDSTTGTIVAGGRGVGGWEHAPVILIGTDQPGGSAGNHVYKLTAQIDTADCAENGIVAFRKMMGLAKSR